MQSMDDWTQVDVYERFGAPSIVRLVQAPGVDLGASAPRYVVEFACIPAPKYFTNDALLVDFGEAFPFGHPPRPEDIGIPLQYRAPETMFESKVGPESEVWSLACVLYEIRAGDPLFMSFFGGNNEIIEQMVQTKGKLPNPWWKAWEKRSLRFDEDGKPLKELPDGIYAAVETSIKEHIEEIGSDDEEATMSGSEVSILEPMGTKVPENEAESMEDLLERMLTWAPDERLTVEEVLRHPWVSGTTLHFQGLTQTALPLVRDELNTTGTADEQDNDNSTTSKQNWIRAATAAMFDFVSGMTIVRKLTEMFRPLE